MATITVARVYQQSFQAHPNTTLAFTGGTLNALGDLVAQRTQNAENEDPHPYDYARTFRFFCYGFTISPLIGRWNSFLEHRFPLRSILNPSQSNSKALAKRVAYDQLVVAPLGLAAFLGSMGIMEGRSASQTVERFRDLYKPALLANWGVWPLVQFCNFSVIPLAYRVPFQAMCGVFWTVYLSVINSKYVALSVLVISDDKPCSSEDAKQDRSISNSN
ncbi:hypothetical protein CPB85DRAFT_1209269 [Mucidula mucida]|nr:hypothetical protein CPB85DRAFT_1209269 [Mucidula mucida]